ncbi:MAG: hypothetical protein ACK5XN_34210, partial [Bacteroidota bacterium]
MEKQVTSLTRELLNSGAFNHLSDTELSRIPWLLLKPSLQQAEALMHYWYVADFVATGVPQDLMHECNFMLQCRGRRGLELLVEADYEG